MSVSRDQAMSILDEHVEDDGLKRHMKAVEAAMRHYAEKLGGDADDWSLAGLLHDFDWEIHPTLEAHPKEGAPILRERGVDESVVQAILSHNTEGTGVERERPIDYALLACDEVTGLIIAAALVRPHKDLRQLKVKSIKRNWKDKLFAAGVDREHVRGGHGGLLPGVLRREARALGARGERARRDAGRADELELDGRLAG